MKKYAKAEAEVVKSLPNDLITASGEATANPVDPWEGEMATN